MAGRPPSAPRQGPARTSGRGLCVCCEFRGYLKTRGGWHALAHGCAQRNGNTPDVAAIMSWFFEDPNPLTDAAGPQAISGKGKTARLQSQPRDVVAADLSRTGTAAAAAKTTGKGVNVTGPVLWNRSLTRSGRSGNPFGGPVPAASVTKIVTMMSPTRMVMIRPTGIRKPTSVIQPSSAPSFPFKKLVELMPGPARRRGMWSWPSIASITSADIFSRILPRRPFQDD